LIITKVTLRDPRAIQISELRAARERAELGQNKEDASSGVTKKVIEEAHHDGSQSNQPFPPAGSRRR
jgi:hypothetical protein